MMRWWHLEQDVVGWIVGLREPLDSDSREVGVPRRVGDCGGVVDSAGRDGAGLQEPPVASSVLEHGFDRPDGGGVSGKCVLGKVRSGVRRSAWNSLMGVGDGEGGRAGLETSLPMVY
jgi:hypothetical protein